MANDLHVREIQKVTTGAYLNVFVLLASHPMEDERQEDTKRTVIVMRQIRHEHNEQKSIPSPLSDLIHHQK